jgi:trk system potassium uptake protein
VTLAAHSSGRVSWFGGRGERLLSPGRYSSLVANVVGLTIAVVGVGIAVSGVVEAIDGGPHVLVLGATGLVVWAVGSVMWRATIVPKQIRILDVFTTVTLSWVAMAVAGAIPYLLTGHFDRIDDALFESISGFTTTGATVTADIEATSRACCSGARPPSGSGGWG